MKKSKATKRTLLLSVLAMLLCMVMLVGTTFAWFTDSASTAVNTIQAGTLDIALKMKDANDGWVDAEGKTLQFKTADNRTTDILWEPGATYALPAIKIVNNGNLWLKYKVEVAEGITKKGEETSGVSLLNAIDFYVFDNGEDIADIIDAIANGTARKMADYFAQSEATEENPHPGVPLAPSGSVGSSSKLLTIVGHMKETAGNEYQGLTLDGVAITVLATQYTKEYDSYTDQYDKDADYPVSVSSAQSIRDAIEAGSSNLFLTEDITIEDGIQLGIKNDTAIDFNGNTLKGAVESGSISSSDGPTNLVLSDPNNNGEYSIDGNIVRHEGGGYTQLAAITVWKPTVTIQSGKYTHDDAVILCQLQTQDPDAVGVVINGGKFDGKGAASVIANIFGKVIVNDGEFNAHYDGDSSGECVYVSSGNSYVPSITTINGGTFNADKRIFYVKVNTSYTQKIVVNGGTFNVAEGGSLIQVSSGNASDYLTITGGTFNVDPSAYVDTANYKVTNSGSTWTVTAK